MTCGQECGSSTRTVHADVSVSPLGYESPGNPEMLMRRVTETLLLVLLFPIFGQGQAAENNWDDLKQLSPGQRIRIVLNDAKSYEGRFQRLTDDAIVAHLKSGDQTFERQSVLRVSRRHKPHRGRNALIGAVAGAATLLIYDQAGCSDCDQGTKAGDTIGGALLGAAVGALVPTGVGWKDLYRAR